MDSTVISILIAIAIMAYQVFNEKKKKEMAKREKEGGASPTGSSSPPLNSGISALFADMLREREEDEYQEQEYDLEDESPYASLKPVEPKVEIERAKITESFPGSGSYSGESGRIMTNLEIRNLKIEEGMDKDLENVQRDIYDSSEIADHDYNEESVKSEGVFKGGFDPALLIVYSEIAKPKFED